MARQGLAKPIKKNGKRPSLFVEEVADSEEERMDTSADTPPENEDEDEEDGDVFEVERVTDHKFDKGTRLYFVRWKGYGDADMTWEPEENLDNAKAVLQRYKDSIGGTPEPDSGPHSSKKRKREKSSGTPRKKMIKSPERQAPATPEAPERHLSPKQAQVKRSLERLSLEKREDRSRKEQKLDNHIQKTIAAHEAISGPASGRKAKPKMRQSEASASPSQDEAKQTRSKQQSPRKLSEAKTEASPSKKTAQPQASNAPTQDSAPSPSKAPVALTRSLPPNGLHSEPSPRASPRRQAAPKTPPPAYAPAEPGSMERPSPRVKPSPRVQHSSDDSYSDDPDDGMASVASAANGVLDEDILEKEVQNQFKARKLKCKPGDFPPNSWELYVDRVSAVDQTTGVKRGQVLWHSGWKSSHRLEVLYIKCPNKVCLYLDTKIRFNA